MTENREKGHEVLRRWIEEASYEVLPTEKSLELISIIPDNNPVRVTCRPTGVEDTVCFVEALGYERAGRVIPHIAARRLYDETHLNNVFARLIASGSKKVFLVGGDGKAGGYYQKAEEVISELYERGIVFDSIGVGGYPEGNAVYDMDPIDVLLRKQALAEKMGVDMEIVTQMCFDTETLYSWVEKIRRNGIYLPVVIGVPGKIKLDTLMKVLPSLGITDVFSFMKSKPRLAKMLISGALGGFDPQEFLRELAQTDYPEANIRGISVFTLGSVTKSVKCLQEM